MRRIFHNKKVHIILFVSVMLSGLFFGCQENLTEPESTDAINLKGAAVHSVPDSGTLPGGALYEIKLPELWNVIPKRVLIVYAHGYVDFWKPIALPSDVVSDGLGGTVSIKDLILGQGLGYASTSYRSNGLAILDGVKDVVELRQTITDYFADHVEYLPPQYVILAGPSEGGLVTVLTIEQHQGLFNAAMATCCPIGNFYNQLQYFGDAHVLFKYFFGESLDGINLGSPKGISPRTINAWIDGSLQQAIIHALEKDYAKNGGEKIMQFLNCANIPVDRTKPEAVVTAILEVMRYSIIATNDAITRLNGNPFNNKYPEPRQYEGSENDVKLNRTIERIRKSDWDEASQTVAEYYETTGNLTIPLVNMHTTGDHISMFSNLIEYRAKTGDSPLLTSIPVNRYGHCTFTSTEVMTALGGLILSLP